MEGKGAEDEHLKTKGLNADLRGKIDNTENSVSSPYSQAKGSHRPPKMQFF